MSGKDEHKWLVYQTPFLHTPSLYMLTQKRLQDSILELRAGTHTPEIVYLHLRGRKNNPFSGCLITPLTGKRWGREHRWLGLAGTVAIH